MPPIRSVQQVPSQSLIVAPQRQTPPEEVSREPSKIERRAQKDTGKGKMGSKAQIEELKTRVQKMEARRLAPPPKISKLERLKRGGRAPEPERVQHYTHKGEAFLYFVREGKGKVRAKDEKELASQISGVSAIWEKRIENLDKAQLRLPEIHDEILELMDDYFGNYEQISSLYKEAHCLLADSGIQLPTLHDAAQDPPMERDALALDYLRGQGPVLEHLKTRAQQRVEDLSGLSQKLEHEGFNDKYQAKLDVLEALNGIQTPINFGLQYAAAQQQGQGISAVISGDFNHVDISGGDMSVAGVLAGVGGGLQIAVEGYALYQNYNRLENALSRQEMARALLADDSTRQQTVDKLQTKIDSLSKPGLLRRLFTKQSSRSQEIARLESKITAIQTLPSSDQLDDKIKAIAKQIENRTDKKFKMLRMAKNVLGIAAGALAIAGTLVTLATPVGWVASGVVLGVTLGCWLYAAHTARQRQGKIDDLNYVGDVLRDQYSKCEAQKDELKTELKEAQTQLQDMMRRDVPDIEQRELRGIILDIEDQLEGLDEEIQTLKLTYEERYIQLLAVDPEQGASEILDGLRSDNEQMRISSRFLAQTVLGLPGDAINNIISGEMPLSTARDLMLRALNLDPRY